MLLALVVLATSLYAGLAFARRYLPEHRLYAALPVGVAFSTWATALAAYLLGFSEWSILAGQLLLLAVLWRWDGPFRLELREHELLGGRGARWAFLLGLLAFAYFNYSLVHLDGEGDLRGIPTDAGFHLSQVTTIAKGGNFPPRYPTIGAEPLTYYYFVNLYSASLLRGGAGLELAGWVPLSLLGAALVALLYVLARKAFKDPIAAPLAVLLVLLNGSFAFLPWMSQNQIDTPGEFLGALASPHFYGGYYKEGYAVANLLTAFVLLERPVLAGLGLALVVLLLFLEGKGARKEWAVGLLLGLTPLFHLFLFLLTLGLLGLYWLLWDRKRAWLEGLALAVVLALPQLVYFAQKAGGAAQAFRLHWGWMATDPSPWGWVFFWLANLGPHLALAALAWPHLSKEWRRLYLCALPGFVILNVVSVTPWIWDNIKFLLLFLVLTGLLAGGGLASLWRRREAWAKPLALIVFVLATFSGALNLQTVLAESGLTIYPAGLMRACAFIENGTDPAKLFVTNGEHTCLFTTAGRRIFLGFDEWAINHGFDYNRTLLENNAMLAGDCERVRHYNVGYYYEGGLLGRSAPVNRTFLAERGRKIYDDTWARVWALQC